ncbi:MAG TPA: zinc-dependent metalloprotease [Microbacteriaceae bacterium]|nr:zinc-dependent metalloprotease [Microbacteriaceae bacterium]
MADHSDEDDDFESILRSFLSGSGPIDASRLAGAAGLPADPTGVAWLFASLQDAVRQGDDSIHWEPATQQAERLAADGARPVDEKTSAGVDAAFHVAGLWLSETVQIAELTAPPASMTRTEWVRQTMQLWVQMAEPVALSISDAITRVFREQAPEQLRGMAGGAEQAIRAVGGALFALQLGQVVGQLSREVVSGGDIGIPLLEAGRAGVVPQNIEGFGEGLDIPADQVQLYLAVRELAHARLFRHARWLRLQMISAITAYAKGITIDTGQLQQLAEGFNPSNPDELRQILADGTLIPPKSAAQEAALTRLETTLALIEGWVDVVTRRATTRLPKSDAVAETVRRRRAIGGPAERAFATLVGLELRPRRLREAAALWEAVTEAVGPEGRDALWSHPDLLPTAADLDDPTRLVDQLRERQAGHVPEPDDLDKALADILAADGDGGDPSASGPGPAAGTGPQGPGPAQGPESSDDNDGPHGTGEPDRG